MLQPTGAEASNERGRVTTKIVTKKLASGEVKSYRYYQLVRTQRRGKKVKSLYLRYLGKDPGRHVAANRAIYPNQIELPLVAANQGQAGLTPASMAHHDVAANRAASLPSLDFEVIPPEDHGLWSFPLYRATCRRCGRKFEMIKFEVEMGHYLCHKCRFEIIRLGERSAWPGY
jgi:hypothetical protein